MTITEPLNIAHRGGAGLWPENTMAAFRRAKEMGVDGFELDVHITRDGEIAVYHDEALKPDITRDANGGWIARKDMLLKDMTFAELQAFDVGRLKPNTRYAAEHPEQTAFDGERIPHLRDVIRQVKGTGLKLWIELKSNFTAEGRTAAPEVFAEKTIALLEAENALEHAVIIGFDWRPLVLAKRLAPSVPIWFTTLPQSWFGDASPPQSHWPPSPPELAQLRRWDFTTAPWTAGFDKGRHGGLTQAIKAGGADAWFPFFPDLTPETVAEASAQGLQTGGWTVNEVHDMQRLIALGVHAICTDRPDRLAAILAP
jgi:glycerophosphoryl diester phosphodiesterase